jgi:hypothetical protein
MLKRPFGFVSLFPIAFCLAQAQAITQDITGDWIGTFATPAGDRRIALHISKADTALKATLDSVNEGVTGIPLPDIKLAESKLTFKLAGGEASFDGIVDAAGITIEGTLEGGAGSVPMTFRRGRFARIEHKPAKPTDIDGDWTGTLNAKGPQTYVFHIANTQDGLIATMDAPSQKVMGAEASSVTRHDSSLSIEWKVFGSQFQGKIAEDRSAIEGSVSQGDHSFPLTLKRVP